MAGIADWPHEFVRDALPNARYWCVYPAGSGRGSRGCIHECGSMGARVPGHPRAHPSDTRTRPRDARQHPLVFARASMSMRGHIRGMHARIRGTGGGFVHHARAHAALWVTASLRMRPRIARTRASMTWNVLTHTRGCVSPSRARSTPSRGCEGPSLGTAACFPQNRVRIVAHGRAHAEGSARACGACAHACAELHWPSRGCAGP
jgi:hypothetical protein